MAPRPREYRRPATAAEAQELLRREAPRTTPLMLGPRTPDALYADVDAVVDLSGLDLAYVRAEGGEIHIGALTALQDLADSKVLQSLAGGVLAEAARASAASGMRHVATFGGALLTRDGPPEVRLAVSALDYLPGAAVVIQGADRYELPLSGWERPLPGEILLEVKFAPPPEPCGGALERVARTPRDEAIVAAAAVVEANNGVARRVRVAVGPCAPGEGGHNSWCSVKAETTPDSQATTEYLFATVLQALEKEVEPLADFRASAGYRRAMAGVLARRALARAWEAAQARQ
jgi:CO/xanthine dehydrogenase FAD-binding subunit